MARAWQRLRVVLPGLVLLSCASFGHAQNVITSTPYTTYAPVFPSPYWGYSADPYGGYLHGAAAVIQSQGRFLIDRQQANLMKQQVRAAKLDNRRRELEQWLWERQTLPTLEDERERLQREQLRRSR